MTIQPTRVVQPSATPAEQPPPEQPKSTAAPKTTKYPQTLPNGDVLITVMEQGIHKAELFERKDPSQYIRFHVVCSCGVEGRFNDLNALKGFIEYHLRR